MSLLSQHFNFIYPWRSYQERFLTGFDTHLEDDHLHVVAPPGSGKTVLGLEMVNRLDQKTLILSPTLTIRNQWNERMLECFVKDPNAISVSFDIKNPSTLTFSTYQSLHSFFRNDMESTSEKIIEFFTEQGVSVLVMDEAHHLKNEWWKPLFSLKKLPNCTLISLTATPPYDSETSEIKKYFDLCGPIDMEIGVPELVKEGNLCPHQDYIYFSQPDQEQIRYIIAYREQLNSFANDLKANEAFISFIKEHPFYAQTESVLEAIYNNPAFYSSLLIFLNAVGLEIPKEKTEFLGIEGDKVTFPSLTYEWMETLLQYFLIENRDIYSENENLEPLLISIERQLKKIGALDHKRINLTGENKLYRSLSQSPTKLKSIVEITKLESGALEDDLRMVVLSDYIRKEFLDFNHRSDLSEINKLGVIPIFQYLRRTIAVDPSFKLKKEKLGVLTGSLIVIHNSLVDDLSQRISSEAFNQEILWDSEYVLIKPTNTGKKEMVSAITYLFETGAIQVLVGTKSLLGEGWDAPAVNTLILASFVGSFVMSNQMRGRAIRVNPKKPNKVANIWHIACVDPTSAHGGVDVAILMRRFDAFCGISLEDKPYIENGADRLGLRTQVENVNVLNTKMTTLAVQRNTTAKRWKDAIEKGTMLVRELKLDYKETKTFKQQKKIYYLDAVKYAFMELGAILMITLPELLLKNLGALLSRGLLYFFYAMVSAIAMLFLPKTVKAILLYLKFGRKDKALIKIARAIQKAMQAKGMIDTTDKKITVVTEKFDDGSISIYLTGASAKEGLQFVDFLQQIIAPVENPRYLIAQSGWLRKKLKFVNYYSVPEVFGERKNEAELFFKHWTNHSKNSELVYTRRLEGRKLLLKARFHSYQKDDNNLTSKKALLWK